MTPLRLFACFLVAAFAGVGVALVLHKRDEIDAGIEAQRWTTFQASCDQRGGLATRYGNTLLCLKPQSILDLESR